MDGSLTLGESMAIAEMVDAILLVSQVVIILRPLQGKATLDEVCNKSWWT